METLKEKIRSVVAWYVRPGFNGAGFLVADDDAGFYSVFDVSDWQGKRLVDHYVTVRLINDMVIIERDQTNRPVVDKLEEAGIPREKIILAYNGETVPSELDPPHLNYVPLGVPTKEEEQEAVQEPVV